MRALTSGVTFAWCTLAALSGKATEDAAARALIATQAFFGPTSLLADRSPPGVGSSLGTFSTGARPASFLVRHHPSAELSGRPAAEAFANVLQADRLLIDALDAAATDPLLSGWRDIVSPLQSENIPAGLWDWLPTFDDTSLDRAALSAPDPPIATSWMPLPPRQTPSPGYCPRQVADLMLPATRARVYQWLERNLQDVVAVLWRAAQPPPTSGGIGPQPWR